MWTEISHLHTSSRAPNRSKTTLVERNEKKPKRGEACAQQSQLQPIPGALTNGARKLNVITHVCDFQILLLRHLCFCRANDLDLFLLISGCYITESKRKRERNVVQAHKGEIAHRLTSKVELQCPSHRVNNATEVFFFS